MSIAKRIKNKLARLNYRRNYYLSKLLPAKVPVTPLYYLPDGFSVHTVANTGIRVIDNFCTREEADYLIGLESAAMTDSELTTTAIEQ